MRAVTKISNPAVQPAIDVIATANCSVRPSKSGPAWHDAGKFRLRQLPAVMRPGSLRLGDRLLVKETHAASFDRPAHDAM